MKHMLVSNQIEDKSQPNSGATSCLRFWQQQYVWHGMFIAYRVHLKSIYWHVTVNSVLPAV